jgi:hypothetical protein
VLPRQIRKLECGGHLLDKGYFFGHCV